MTDIAAAAKAPTVPPRAMAAPPGAAPTLCSGDLLAGRRVVVIRHGDDDYRLQLTRSGKLILTK